MASTVHFADLRAGLRENLHDKLERLLENAGLDEVVATGDLTAIKLHFGERGGHAYLRPTFVRRVVDRVRVLEGNRFSPIPVRSTPANARRRCRP